MLHALLKIFGLDPVVPKRPPTARKKPSVKPPAIVYDEVARDYDRPVRLSWEEKEERKAAASIRSVGAALRVFARHTGQVGTRPSPQYVAAARRVLGERRWAYLLALRLADKPTPTLPEASIGNPDREAGITYGLDRDAFFKLDVWEAISTYETAAHLQARRAGQQPPPSITIPEDIQERLRELRKLRAAPLMRKGGEGRGKSGGGPEAPAPDAPPPETPVVTEVTPETPPKGTDPVKPEGDEPPAGPGKP